MASHSSNSTTTKAHGHLPARPPQLATGVDPSTLGATAAAANQPNATRTTVATATAGASAPTELLSLGWSLIQESITIMVNQPSAVSCIDHGLVAAHMCLPHTHTHTAP